ncbi:MAG TPA: hypothetical protein VD931_06925 [Baekduia sp.]|nr:hypothetical protein [Baekduia sp.]
MPTFCRHNRFAENCPICSRKPRTQPSSPASTRREKRPGAPAKPKRSSTSRGGGTLVVKRMARAADDGFASDLVPGLRASADAARLADEIAFSAARLEELEVAPPGLLAEIAGLEDREEAAWLCFLVAWLAPTEDDDPWAGIRAARVPWATGELPTAGGVALGERTAFDPKRAEATVAAYRGWAAKAGGQVAALTGEPSWEPQRRFDRAFERLALPGLHRAARFELLLLASRLGLVEAEPWSLELRTAPADPVAVAAKRIFGIGDVVLLDRRIHELAAAAGAPVAGLDLALFNWSRQPDQRVRAGSQAEPDAGVRERLRAALRLAPAD